jgi:hypothetical protein
MGMTGFALRGIELAHRRFVDVQTGALPEQFSQPLAQGLQRDANLADPFSQG